MRLPITIIIHLTMEWETFHRRAMIEALAKNAQGVATVLCINPPQTLRQLVSKKRRRADRSDKARVSLRNIQKNLYLFTPYFLIPLLGRFNIFKRYFFSSKIIKVLKRIGAVKNNSICWIYRPEQITRLRMARENFVVYECYDEYTLDILEGKPLPETEALENELLKKVDVVLTTATSLFEKRRSRHERVYYTPMGADFELFSKVMDPCLDVAEEILNIPRPRIGYIGFFTKFSLDLDILEYLASIRPNWSLIFVGPIDSSPEGKVERLNNFSNVHILDKRKREELPRYVKGFDVAIIPYRMNEFGQLRIPNKMWEFMAAGKPIVSTRLKEIEMFQDIVFLAGDKEEYVEQINNALLQDNVARIKRGIELAQDYSWDKLTKKTLDIIIANLLKKDTQISHLS